MRVFDTPPQRLLSKVGIKLTPLFLHQYFAACATDPKAEKVTQEEVGLLFVALGSVDSQTFLLPQDYYFFVDPSSAVRTGSRHAFGKLDVQGLYILLHGIGFEVSVAQVTDIIENASKSSTGMIT